MHKIALLGVFTAAMVLGMAPQAASAKANDQTVLVTGANRGIGLEFARQFSQAGWHVLATARDPAKANELKQLGANVEVLALDVTDSASVAAMAKALAGRPIDLVINNAGAGVGLDGGPKLDMLNVAKFEQVLAVNTVGPVRVTQALLPNLRAGKGRMVVCLSSSLGSIRGNSVGGFYGYRESKAALDMFVRNLASELRSDGFRCIAIAPGWVKTEMGGPNADLTPEQSVTSMRKVLDGLRAVDSGKFFNYDGSELPW